MASYYPNVSIDNFLGGGKKKTTDTSQYTTTNNPYMQYGGRYYDWGGFDPASYTGGKNIVQNTSGQFGYWDESAARNKPTWVSLPRQPRQVSAPLTPAGLERQNLTKEMQDAMDEANRKNEERYQQALANLEGVGEQERADINTTFDSSRSAVNQGLINSGLAGTTVAPSMQRGVERERVGALNRLASMLARERNQVIIGRNDVPPDLQAYINLMYQTGTGGNR